jgi:hypothetical protein
MLHVRLTINMRWVFLVIVLSASLFAADVADMSGTWVLEVQRSKWNKKPPPKSVRITIEHNEPKLKYEGTITDADEVTRNFAFDGAIDGKDYNGVKVQRLSPYSTTSTLKSEDGKTEEVTTTTVTKNGNHLVRRVQSTGPDGKQTWTELYQKEQ